MRAASSARRSRTKHASGRPAPRYASVGTVLVNTPVTDRMDRRRRVDAREQRGVDRARDRRTDRRHVGAEVRHGLDAEPEEAAARIERESQRVT